MAGKKEDGTRWRQASVMIRADIFGQAREQKIDISDTVNRALAERLGIDYRQQKIPEGTIAEPVIIAPNAAPVLPERGNPEPGAGPAAAIINADDPQAAKAVKTRRSLPKERPAFDGPAVQVPAPGKEAIPRRETPPPEKAKKPAAPRKKKEDPAKKFFGSMVLREDAGDALISKDDMFNVFERWCREHHILPIPEKKAFAVTLKNQCAVREKMVNGTPSWIGIRLKQHN